MRHRHRPGEPRPSVRIGCGAGFAGDRLEAARELLREGELDYLVLECLAERTLALAQQRRSGGGEGYDPLLEARMRMLLPDAMSRGVGIITNAGAADPLAAGRMVGSLAAELGLEVVVGVVEGDDVFALVDDSLRTIEHDRPLAAYGPPLSANAYLGSEPLVEALARGADVVITGRVADAALFVAPALFHHGAGLDDAGFLANATIMGHLLECGAQVTGGYFADGDGWTVPDLPRVGLPIAEVAPDGGFTLSKPPGSGGLISRAVVTEQLLYEITDPHAYLTPDAVVDVAATQTIELDERTVAVRAGRPAGPAPAALKVSVGYAAGLTVEAEISYMGAHHESRGGLAARILEQRLAFAERVVLERHSGVLEDSRGASYGCTRLRIAAHVADRASADRIAREVSALYTNGPAGGSGIRTAVEPLIGIVSALIDRSLVRPRVTMIAGGSS